MQILVDSSVWIDYFTGKATPETDYLDSLIGESALLVADVVMEEILSGLQDEAHRRQAWDALVRFWLIEVRGVNLAWKSAVSCQTLRARGIKVRHAECPSPPSASPRGSPFSTPRQDMSRSRSTLV